MKHLPKLKVSQNRRFLQTEEGAPFFYLGDTAWELFHRLNEVDVQKYCTNRAAKGFNVIQAVALAELDGHKTPNANGHFALIDDDPAKPNEDYFKHVDFTVNYANSLGMYVGLLPCWGNFVCTDNWNPLGLITEKNAYGYGEFLARRYKENGIIWILGGDRPANGYEKIWEQMALGIRSVVGNTQLIAYHPRGYQRSSVWFHNAEWCDFNAIQSGHYRQYNNNYEMIAMDYALTPPKPTLDMEPCYEDHPIGFHAQNGWFDEYDCRLAAYRAVFAGAFGHTYGTNSVWQMYDTGRSPIAWARRPWHEALNQPGATQMRFLKNLMLAHPFFSRIPDQSVIIQENDWNGSDYKGFPTDYCLGTRDGTVGKNDATYIMVHTPRIVPFWVNASLIPAQKLRCYWYCPRTGQCFVEPVRDNIPKLDPLWHHRPWHVKTEGMDWVYVVEDASKNYPLPNT